MPTNPIEITTAVEAAPPVRVVYSFPLLVGREDGGDQEIVEISSYSDADAFGGDGTETENLKGMLDEAGAPVYGYMADVDTENADDWPDDLDSTVLESELEMYPEIETVLFDDVDMVDDSSEINDLETIANNQDMLMLSTIYAEDGNDVYGQLTDVNDSKHIFAVAHPYTEDGVEGKMLGAMQKVKPHDKLMWKSINSLDTHRDYTSSDVEDIEDENVNAIITKNRNAVFSSGMTYTDDELYRWVDGVRSKFFIKERLTTELELLLANSFVPYNGRGIAKVRNKIRGICREFEEIGMAENYSVRMPDYDEITADDRDDRILRDVEVGVRLAGHIQEITIDLVLRF